MRACARANECELSAPFSVVSGRYPICHFFPMMPSSTLISRGRSPLSALAFAVFAALVHLPAQAQALPPGVHIGMSADDLQAAVPGVERVPRPLRLAGGLSGGWRAPPSVIGGLPFEPVFYFAGGQLRRIEWTAAAEGQADIAAAAFGRIVDWGRQSFGPELGSNDPGSAYAAWVDGDWDVYAQRSADARHASVRLVYKARQLKDGSEL
jgi:hypothetical protein